MQQMPGPRMMWSPLSTITATRPIILSARRTRYEVKSNGTLYRLREASIENGTGNIKQVRLSFGSGMAVHNLGYDQYGNIKSRKGPANKKGQRYVMD